MSLQIIIADKQLHINKSYQSNSIKVNKQIKTQTNN